jgi:hypothetical protein
LQQLSNAANDALVSSGGSLVTELLQSGMRATRPGCRFSSWAVLNAEGRCRSCDGSNSRCSHAQLVSGFDAAASGPATAEQPSWDDKVGKDMDYGSDQ